MIEINPDIEFKKEVKRLSNSSLNECMQIRTSVIQDYSYRFCKDHWPEIITKIQRSDRQHPSTSNQYQTLYHCITTFKFLTFLTLTGIYIRRLGPTRLYYSGGGTGHASAWSAACSIIYWTFFLPLLFTFFFLYNCPINQSADCCHNWN